jgi:hypothetical protein
MRAVLYQAAVNTSAIAVSSTNSLGVTLTHNAGADWTIERFAISYNGASPLQAGALIALYDSQHNRFLLPGYCSLGALGFPRSGTAVLAAAPALMRELVYPVTLKAGQSMQLFVTTDNATSFAANDLCLLMHGYQDVAG